MEHLPPKIPTTAQNWPSFPYQPFSNRVTSIAATNTSIGNSNSAMSDNSRSSWVDEFLDFTNARRGHHRQSITDRVTFVEAAGLLPFLDEPNNTNILIANDNISSNDEIIDRSINPTNALMSAAMSIGLDDRLDDEQLLSMFTTDDISLALQLPSSSNTSTLSSDRNSNSEEKPTALVEPQPPQLAKARSKRQRVEAGTVNSSCGQEPQETTVQPPAFSSGDPKRVKRILANRQSAQRSRVRKLQYISELERSVTTLQTEVCALQPKVAFLDHQRLILNVDNSALKQRIAALAQDKIFKDAHQEALKKEIERLRQVYHQQNHKDMHNYGNHSDKNTPS